MTTSSSLETVNMSTSTESEAVSLDSIPLYNIANTIYFMCPPVILVFGLLGNVMTLVIMYRMTSAHKDSSTFPLYFTSIAIADLTVQLTKTMPEWVYLAFGYLLLDLHAVICKLFFWLRLSSVAASSWYLVLLSLHRAVSVVWPHRVHMVCTRRLVLVLLSAITLFLAALYSHCLYGFDLLDPKTAISRRCLMKDAAYKEFMVDVFVLVILVVYSVLPFVCLVLANGVLVWKLTASVRQARHALTAGDAMQTRQKATQSVTLTVIVVSLTFLLLTLPLSVYNIMSFRSKEYVEVTGHEYAKVYFFSAVAYTLADCNCAVNFYLYCLTGRRFREEFLKVLLCWKKGAGKETDQATAGTGLSDKVSENDG